MVPSISVPKKNRAVCLSDMYICIMIRLFRSILHCGSGRHRQRRGKPNPTKGSRARNKPRRATKEALVRATSTVATVATTIRTKIGATTLRVAAAAANNQTPTNLEHTPIPPLALPSSRPKPREQQRNAAIRGVYASAIKKLQKIKKQKSTICKKKPEQYKNWKKKSGRTMCFGCHGSITLGLGLGSHSTPRERLNPP